MTAPLRLFPAILAAAIAFSQPLLAEPIYIDDATACESVRGSEYGDEDYAADGGMILFPDGFGSLEYFCSFEPALGLDTSTYSVTDHYGHCEFPGPQYFPQLFTIVIDPEEPGAISIWMGEEEPLKFFACAE